MENLAEWIFWVGIPVVFVLYAFSERFQTPEERERRAQRLAGLEALERRYGSREMSRLSDSNHEHAGIGSVIASVLGSVLLLLIIGWLVYGGLTHTPDSNYLREGCEPWCDYDGGTP